jgi:anti-sigma B factor antagonist
MTETVASLEVRSPAPGVSVIAIAGEVTRASDLVLQDAYERASDGARVIMLDFGGLEYMNSSGIGLLVTLLVRAQRNRQHFELTRLDEVISIHETEESALAAL